MSENRRKRGTKTFLSLNRKRRRLDQGSNNRKKVDILINAEDSHFCPICRSNIKSDNVCRNCSIIQNTPSSTQTSSQDNPAFSHRVHTELPCSSTPTCSSKSHVHQEMNKNDKTMRKKSKYARKYFKKRSQHVQVNLSYGINKTVQVNIPTVSCIRNVSSEAIPNVTFTKSSQTILWEKEHISVQTKSHDEHLNECEYSPTVTDFFSDFWEILNKSDQSKDFSKLASSLMSEDIPIDNLAWLSALHIGRYVKFETTCSMKYDQKYSEFFSLLYLFLDQLFLMSFMDQHSLEL